MTDKDKSVLRWWQIALKPTILKRALRVALLVGTILMVINHGDKLLWGGINSKDVIKICLTYIVPYSVSTYSSVLTWFDEHTGK